MFTERLHNEVTSDYYDLAEMRAMVAEANRRGITYQGRPVLARYDMQTVNLYSPNGGLSRNVRWIFLARALNGDGRL